MPPASRAASPILTADNGYWSERNLAELEDRGIWGTVATSCQAPGISSATGSRPFGVRTVGLAS